MGLIEVGMTYEMRRVLLWVFWAAVVVVTLFAVLGCSESRATVEDIQGEFESRGFELHVLEFRYADDVLKGFSPARGTILLIKGQSPKKGVAWDSVELAFNNLAGWRYDAELQAEYIFVLASILMPNTIDDFTEWLVDAGTGRGIDIRRFGNMTVQHEHGGDTTRITFWPDKD